MLAHMANRTRFGAVADLGRVTYMRPSDVTHRQIGDDRRLTRAVPGAILGGDWDLKVIGWEEFLAGSLKFLGLKEHFADGVPWVQTRLFTERYQAEFERRRRIRGCRTLAELAAYYEIYDRLYQDLRVNGFRASCPQAGISPIPVYIGRNGSIIFTNNGNHRLFMALLLGIETMPVEVAVRHAQWQNTRDTLHHTGAADFARAHPSLRGHPDLRDLIHKGR